MHKLHTEQRKGKIQPVSDLNSISRTVAKRRHYRPLQNKDLKTISKHSDSKCALLNGVTTWGEQTMPWGMFPNHL